MRRRRTGLKAPRSGDPAGAIPGAPLSQPSAALAADLISSDTRGGAFLAGRCTA